MLSKHRQQVREQVCEPQVRELQVRELQVRGSQLRGSQLRESQVRECHSAPVSPNGKNRNNTDIEDYDDNDDFSGGENNRALLSQVIDARFKRRLELEETRFEAEQSCPQCELEGIPIVREGFFRVVIPGFKIPIRNHTPKEVIRLFPESSPTYRTMVICGKRVSAFQRIQFLEICYGRISKALGLKVNSASLAWELCAKIKSGEQCLSPAQQVMNALTFNHWANAWVEVLPSKYPSIFHLRQEPGYAYDAELTRNTENVPLNDYAVMIDRGRINCIQRKNVTIRKRRQARPVATITIELHSIISIKSIKANRDNWTGQIRITPPLFELDASPSEQREIMGCFKSK